MDEFFGYIISSDEPLFPGWEDDPKALKSPGYRPAWPLLAEKEMVNRHVHSRQRLSHGYPRSSKTQPYKGHSPPIITRKNAGLPMRTAGRVLCNKQSLHCPYNACRFCRRFWGAYAGIVYIRSNYRRTGGRPTRKEWGAFPAARLFTARRRSAGFPPSAGPAGRARPPFGAG